MANQTTSIAQLQQQEEYSNEQDMNLGSGNNSLEDLDAVINEMDRGNGMEQQQYLAAQQQQNAQAQAQLLAQQQHQAQMMANAAAAQQQGVRVQNAPPPLLLPPPQKAQQSFVDRVMAELKDVLLVVVVFVVLNFPKIQSVLSTTVSKFTTNTYLVLLLQGCLAGVLFYLAKKMLN